MQYYDERKPRLVKCFTLLVILYPLTSVYATPIRSVSFGDTLMMLAMVLLLFDMFSKHLKLRIISFWLYICYSLLVTIICSFIFVGMNASYSMNDAINRLARDGYFLITIVVFGSYYFDFQYGKKMLKIFCIALGCFIIYQFVSYKVSGVYIPGIIPNLTTTISGGMTGSEYNSVFQHKAEVYGFIRSSGFLAEPAIVGQVVSVALLLELFTREKKTNILLSIFYSIILVLTFSTNSYVALVLCWGVWALYSNRYNRKNIIGIFTVLVFLVIGLVALFHNENTASVFARFYELQDRTSGSSVIRVLRGMYFYFNMPLQYQIFGSGFGNFYGIKDIYGITTIYETDVEYMNTDAYILVSAGLIGFLLFIVTILQSARGNEIVSKMIFMLLLVFGLSSSIYSTPQFMIMMMFILFAPKENKLDEDSYHYAS